MMVVLLTSTPGIGEEDVYDFHAIEVLSFAKPSQKSPATLTSQIGPSQDQEPQGAFA